MKPYFQDAKANISLYHGDCREIVPALLEAGRKQDGSRTMFDIILTDSPYGVNAIGKNGRIGGTSKDVSRRAGQINHDYIPVHGDDKPIEPAFLLESSKDQILWGGNYIADKLPAGECWLVWYKRIKGQTNNFADCELAWTSLKKPSRVFQHLWMGMLRDSEMQEHHHGTQKPVALMHWCLDLVPDVKTVLDPYCGSGPVAVACKNRGLTYIGIDIEERHLETAASRLQQEQLPLVTEAVTEKMVPQELV